MTPSLKPRQIHGHQMPARYAGTCDSCSAPIARRQPIWWIAAYKVAVCLPCKERLAATQR